jgi:hypothetical protein
MFGRGGHELGLPSAGWRVQLLVLGLSGGEVYHQDPLYLEGQAHAEATHLAEPK